MNKDTALGGSRLARLQRTLRRAGKGPVVVAGRRGVYYLSGFTGSFGWLLVTPRRAFLVTDFRYREQAREEAAGGIEVLAESPDPVQALAGLCRRRRWRRLEVEESGMSLKDYRRLAAGLKGCRVTVCRDLTGRQRMVKDGRELRLLREASRRCDRVWSRLLPLLKSSMTELEVADLLRGLIREEGGAVSFDPIVAAGAHSCQPHARPSRRRLRAGRILMVDFGLEWKGYHSDLTRTLALGRFPPRFAGIYQAVLEAQAAALGAVRPGQSAGKLDLLARESLARRGLDGYFGHSLGHGLGLEVHEGPRINRHSLEVILPGMVFSVEPGLYIPGWGGVRIEDVVIVGGRGAAVLSRTPKDLDSSLLKW